jgi:N-acetylglucosaminyl-diphospho-decaprenol L-rhamnosyltransferase
VDWVSGACFLIRRAVFEAVGGFDERYFMFAEDMALCWQVRASGSSVAAVTSAEVTHIEGLSRSRDSRAMLIAHHRSAMRFEWQTASGLRRALLPLATVVLGFRLFVVLILRPSH